MKASEDDHKVENIDGLQRKIQLLLAKAESSTFPEERRQIEARVQEMMIKYRLRQEDMLAVDEKSSKPILKDFIVSEWRSKFANWFHTAFLFVAKHTGIKSYTVQKKVDGKWYLVAQAVGYDIDLRYAELLWSSIRLEFIAKLEPEFDPKLSEAENIYRLRSSGISRKDVAVKIWGHWSHSNAAKVGKVYKSECIRRGETPALDGKGIDLKTFQEVYAREFTWRIDDRLREARDGAMGNGGAVVFAGREDRVQEAFYEFFPNLRPQPADETVTVEPMPEPAPKKGRKRMAVTETKAYKAKQDRMYNSAAANAGYSAGVRAADGVNIDRVAKRTDRLE